VSDHRVRTQTWCPEEPLPLLIARSAAKPDVFLVRRLGLELYSDRITRRHPSLSATTIQVDAP